MKKLKLKIWVEDEDGKIVSSQKLAGGLPGTGQPNLIELDWTGSDEINYKILINAVATVLKAKYGNDYISQLPNAKNTLKSLL